MSLWRRLFKRDLVTEVARPLSLKEHYQNKVQLYSDILAASNAALEIMAQMQVRLQEEDYFSPAYITLNYALVLDHTRRVIHLLRQFTGDQDLEIARRFTQISDQISGEVTVSLKGDAAALALPFEKHALSPSELLASGIAFPAKEAEFTGALTIKAVWGWWPVVQDGTVHARRYRVAQGQVTECTSPETGLQEQWLTYHPEQGFLMEPLPPSLREQPCLQEEEARQIADYHRLLKTHYPDLQEVEWGLGPNREVLILRSLPSTGPSFPNHAEGGQGQPQLLFSHGLGIYPGQASGPAFRVDADHLPDEKDTPEKVILVANKPALSLAPRLDKAAALLVETGEPHNHLAFVVRERRVPAIFDLREDTSHIPILMMETGMAYAAIGKVDETIRLNNEALQIWKQDGNLTWQANVLNNIGVLHHLLGNYDKAALALEEGLLCAQRSGYYVRTEALILISLGDVYAEVEDFSLADQCYQRGNDIAREIGDRFLLDYLILARAKLLIQQDNLEQASQVLDEARNMISSQDSLYEDGLYHLLLHKANTTKAKSALEIAESRFEADGRNIELMKSQLLLARVFYLENKKSDASQKIKDVLNGIKQNEHSILVFVHQIRTWLEDLQSDTKNGHALGNLISRANEITKETPKIRRRIRRLAQAIDVPGAKLVIQGFGRAQV
ncbi:MAG: tetratricopeptide repeat protein, partial [Desulfobulbales bacterium]